MVKQIRIVEPKSGVSAPKPVAPKLSKSDPAYYSKIGAISAAKRALSKEQFSEMAKKSHVNRKPESYRGGRKKKSGTEMVEP